jgi:CO dehydrogenase/acetyl-CoA synthase delta subunit
MKLLIMQSFPVSSCLLINMALSNETDKIIMCSVSTALGYGLDDRGSRVRIPAGAGNFSLHYRVQNGCRTHPASYPMGTRGSFPWGKAAVA